MKAEIFNYKTWIDLTETNDLIKLVEQLLKQSGFNILDRTTHHFHPLGFTGIWLLSESHLAIHSFPESDKTYLELSSCNKEKNLHFIRLLSAKYQNTGKLEHIR